MDMGFEGEVGDIPVEEPIPELDADMDPFQPQDVELEPEFEAVASEEVNLFEPGPFAGESIPARGTEQTFTTEERGFIDSIGYDTGCHSCGTLEPGTKSGHFVPDHQPPSNWCDADTSQELYPQCLSCSCKQGGQLSHALHID